MAEEIKVVVVGEQGPSGQGVPNLGTTGQYLRKASDTDFDTEWTDSSVSIPGLNDIDDVTLVAAVEGQVLTFNGANWVNQDGVAVESIQEIGNVVITDPQHRDVLVYDGGSDIWENEPLSTGGSGTDNHSALLNLGADDHTHYHTDVRGDIRYYLKSEVDLALIAKSDVNHTHVETDITDLDKYSQLETNTLLDGKANSVHTHVKADITDFSDADYATSAQGSTADSAVQPGDNLSVLNDDLGLVLSSEKGTTIATLDGGGKIPTTQLPNISITDTFVVTSELAMLALTVQTGDVAIRTDLSSTFILQGTDPTLIGSWVELATPTDNVTSVDGRTGTVTLSDLYEPVIGSKGTAFNRNFGITSGTVTEGDDSRLSDARTPLAHTHLEADITDLDKYTQSEVDTLLSGKAETIHTHVLSDITDAGTMASQDSTNISVTGGTAELTSLRVVGGDPNAGTFTWNDAEATVDLTQNGAVLQLGQEIHIHARNTTGSTILNGTPVMATGTVGGSSRITIAPMDGSDPFNANYFLGIATEDIISGTDGKVSHFGKVRGIDTTGTSVGQTWADGDLLYISTTTPGEFTNVEPTVGLSMPIAFIVHAAANGSVLARANPLDTNAYASAIHTHVKSDITDFSDADYATALQGTTADSALQPGDNISELVNDAGYSVDTLSTTTTSGIIPSSLLSISIPNDTQILAVVAVKGYDSVSGDMYWKYIRFGAKTLGGVTTIIGGVSNDLGYDPGAVNWTAVPSEGSGTVSIVVTGESGKNIDWSANLEIK